MKEIKMEHTIIIKLTEPYTFESNGEYVEQAIKELFTTFPSSVRGTLYNSITQNTIDITYLANEDDKNKSK